MCPGLHQEEWMFPESAPGQGLRVCTVPRHGGGKGSGALGGLHVLWFGRSLGRTVGWPGRWEAYCSVCRASGRSSPESKEKSLQVSLAGVGRESQ